MSLRSTAGAIICAGVLVLAGPGLAAPVKPHSDVIVSTYHKVDLQRGRTLDYTAHAGLVPLYVNDTGERMASIFFVAYIADREPRDNERPITFLWNGGPGSNSAQVHFMGFGPRRPRTPDAYIQWGSDTEGSPVVDHPETWLEHSDLVFVDPVGTGFSRATSIEYRDVLYTSRGDAEAVAEFIRVFLTRFDAWDVPLFIAGESYGTTRAMLVSEALERRRTDVDGVILLSGGYDAGQTVPDNLRAALAITEFTAIAHYHEQLPPDLQALTEEEAVQAAEEWARETYAPALASRESLTETERARLLRRITRFTGVDANVDRDTFRLSGSDFADQLLADQGLELGRYDGRITVKARPDGQMWLPTHDPSLERMARLMSGTSRVFNAYVRNQLGFESDLFYRGPFGGAFHPEPLESDPETGLPGDWMAAMFKFDAGSPAGAEGKAPLREAMIMNREMRVMNVKGRYDGSCAALDEAVARTEPVLRERVTNICVPSGHMFYTDLEARKIVKRAFAEFVRNPVTP